MSKENLEAVNTRLVEHLEETGVKDACYYAPVYEDYWFSKKKIAFCNLEPYSVDESVDTIKGIQLLDEKRLYNSWFHAKTTNNTFLLNYVLCRHLEDNQPVSEETFRQIRAEAKENPEAWHGNMCDAPYGFDRSLYFNCRYTQSPTVNEDKGYTVNAYKKDSFYVQHFKDFVKASELDVLVLGGKESFEVVTLVYPELNEKLTFGGDSVLHDGILFVSMTHPSRIGFDEMASVVNKIAEALKTE